MDNSEVRRLRKKLMLRVLVWGLVIAAVLIWKIGKHRTKPVDEMRTNEKRHIQKYSVD
ncbi:MAG: hypothetical protein AB1454_04050 [Candidatus Auribacterota bacterium]|jgi:hypothetical protein